MSPHYGFDLNIPSDIEHWSKGFHQKVPTLWEVSKLGRGRVVNVCGSGQMGRPLEITLPHTVGHLAGWRALRYIPNTGTRQATSARKSRDRGSTYGNDVEGPHKVTVSSVRVFVLWAHMLFTYIEFGFCPEFPFYVQSFPSYDSLTWPSPV